MIKWHIWDQRAASDGCLEVGRELQKNLMEVLAGGETRPEDSRTPAERERYLKDLWLGVGVDKGRLEGGTLPDEGTRAVATGPIHRNGQALRLALARQYAGIRNVWTNMLALGQVSRDVRAYLEPEYVALRHTHAQVGRDHAGRHENTLRRWNKLLNEGIFIIERLKA